MTEAVRNVLPRISTSNDPNFWPVLIPVIGFYFEGKAIDVVNRNIKELIEEEKRCQQINCVPQMRHLIDTRWGIYTLSALRDLFTIALVVTAFVTGYFPLLILAAALSTILGLNILGHLAYIERCNSALLDTKERHMIPTSILRVLNIEEESRTQT